MGQLSNVQFINTISRKIFDKLYTRVYALLKINNLPHEHNAFSGIDRMTHAHSLVEKDQVANPLSL